MWLALLAFAACDKAEDASKSVGDETAVAGEPAVGGGAASASGAAVAPATTLDAGAVAIAADGAVAPPPAPEGYKAGDLISAKWDDGAWYSGKITAVNADGTYGIKYNDGYTAKKQKAKNIKPRKPPPPTSSSSKSSGSSCGGGRTKCGGRCVNLLEDNQNCSSCGRTCPEACMGGSCVSNAYKYGP